METSEAHPQRRVWLNPLAWHELRARMRDGHAAGLLSLFIFITSALVLIVYGVASLATQGQGAGASRTVGTAVFYALTGMQLALVAFGAPALTCGAVTGERERNTFDLLRATALTPRQIISSKLLASLGYVALLIFATLPMFSLTFFLGGIEAGQVAMAMTVSLAAGTLFSVIGLAASCHAPSTASAVVIAYGAIILLLIGSGILLLALSGALLPLTAGASAGGRPAEPTEVALAQLITLGLMSLSPISALIASMLTFANQGDLLRFSFNPAPSAAPGSGLLPAPYLLMIALYLAASAILLILSARRLGRLDP